MSLGVTSGHPLATIAGSDALRAGASVVDAALTAAFTQWVVSPTVCGPGGDLLMLHVHDGETTVYGGWARVPLGLDVSEPLPFTGPRSVVVPGALAGAHAAWTAAGRLPWGDLFGPAIAHSAGHDVTDWMARSYAEVVAKGLGHALPAVLDSAVAPHVDERVSCRRLGHSLSLIADGGASVMYEGQLAGAVVSAAAHGGVALTAADLLAMTADVRPAIDIDLGDCSVAVPGAPSQASIAVELLGEVDPSVPPDSIEFCKAVAARTRDLLIERCVVGLPGTAVSAAVAGDEAAVVVHSLAGVQFGSGWVAGDTGIAFGNRVGTALSTRPDLPGAHPVPGAVVPHTLSAAWFSGPRGSMLVATPGGDRQVQWVAQAGQRFRRGASLDEVISGPRWFVCPEGNRFGVPGGIGREWFLFAEPGVPWATASEVAGFRVKQVPWVGGGLQAIQRRAAGVELASDPRGGGTASTTGDTHV